MLRARLLGALQVDQDGTVIAPSSSQRAWALFSFLALADRPVTRAELASRFWPDVLDQSARASLRTALWTLRRELGDAAITVDGERVSLCADHGLWVDAVEFDRLAESRPDAALELCRGELLDGIEDDWAISARERHRERVVELLEQLASRAEDEADASTALALTRRQVERLPFSEEAHRRLIVRLAAAGDRAAAVQAYRTLTERLRSELGVAPSRITRELIEQVTVEPSQPGHPATRALPAGLTALLGREPELRALEAAWTAAAAGVGGAALIRGEAGIGKTRLATELRARVMRTGALCAASAALDLGGSAPLSLWAELIRELLPSLPAPGADASWPDDVLVLVSSLPAHFARPAADAPNLGIPPDLQRTRLFEAVVALLAWAAAQAPVLLVLDDVHAADAASLELVGYASRRLAGLRILMVMTRRELPRSPAADQLEYVLRTRGVLGCEVELGPLASDRGAVLARSVARLSELDVRRVVERAEGNPLFVVETARAVDRGLGDVAPSLRGAARATLGSLDADARRLVDVAAVATRPMRSSEMQQLGFADADELAGAALQTGLLFADGDDRAAAPQLVRAALDARSVAGIDQAVDSSPRRSRSHPTRMRGSSLASSRRGVCVGTHRGPPSTARSSCSRMPNRLPKPEHGSAGRARTTVRSASHARCWRVPGERSSCSTPTDSPPLRSAARRSPVGHGPKRLWATWRRRSGCWRC